MRAVLLFAFALSFAGCGDDETGQTKETGTSALFELSADLADSAHFFDVPYPNDLRRDASGHPMLAGFPNPLENKTVRSFVINAAEEVGFPVISVTHFRFSRPLGARDQNDIIPAEIGSPILLLDIDEDSPDRGALIPTVAATLSEDPYTATNVLSVGAVPGWVLRPDTTYAIAIMTGLNDEKGKPLAMNPTFERLKKGTPDGDLETRAEEIYAPLWATLKELGVDLESVATATVFTTGNPVKTTHDLGNKVLAAYDLTIEDLALSADPEDQHAELCLLKGTIKYPQFQKGTPPFDTEGLFEMGEDGLPKKQRDEVAPIAIVVPKTPMPSSGYPLLMNVHGSGGFSVSLVTPVGDDGLPGAPIGPAFPAASKGIAMAGSAMPVNPERLLGAEETEYLNLSNFPALRDTFRQGTLEQRLFLEALLELEIPASMLTGCANAPTLPNGATAFKFDRDKVMLTGQSMGGMYTNIIGATEPLVRAVVPTGAGGYWAHFIFITPLYEGRIPTFLKLLLGIDPEKPLGYLHPVPSIAAGALEPADPIVYMPHLARRPLEGHPVRPIYRPVGIGDSYFPTATYDAVALAYGHRAAGEIIWPEMQERLELMGQGELASYVVENEMTSEDGTPYTGVVAQYEADGPYDPHALYSHHGGVKHQYACFLDSFVKTGAARVPPPTEPWESPCE